MSYIYSTNFYSGMSSSYIGIDHFYIYLTIILIACYWAVWLQSSYYEKPYIVLNGYTESWLYIAVKPNFCGHIRFVVPENLAKTKCSCWALRACVFVWHLYAQYASSIFHRNICYILWITNFDCIASEIYLNNIHIELTKWMLSRLTQLFKPGTHHMRALRPTPFNNTIETWARRRVLH